MHIPSNFTSIYLHRKLPFCSMAKGNDRASDLKRKKRREKNQRLVVEQGMVSEYAPTSLYIALRPLNIAQKKMYSTVMLISGRVF